MTDTKLAAVTSWKELQNAIRVTLVAPVDKLYASFVALERATRDHDRSMQNITEEFIRGEQVSNNDTWKDGPVFGMSQFINAPAPNRFTGMTQKEIAVETGMERYRSRLLKARPR